MTPSLDKEFKVKFDGSTVNVDSFREDENSITEESRALQKILFDKRIRDGM
jgi:hypothetical protein